MDAVECCRQYLSKRGDEQVSALINGVRCGAIIVRRLTCGRFLLCWRSSVAAQLGPGSLSDQFEAANWALPNTLRDASRCLRSRAVATNKNPNKEFQSYLSRRMVVSEYSQNNLKVVRGGGAPSSDTKAYPRQVSEWTLEKLAEDGSPPDERTARFILAVLDAAGEHESSPSPSPLSSRTSSMISEKPSPLNISMSPEPEMEPSSSLHSPLSPVDSPASPQKTSPSWYSQSSPLSPIDSSAVTGSNFSGSPAMSRAHSFELPSASSSESTAFSLTATSMEVDDDDLFDDVVEGLDYPSSFSNVRGTKRISAGPEPERKWRLRHPQIQAALLPNWGDLNLGDLRFDDVEM